MTSYMEREGEEGINRMLAIMAAMRETNTARKTEEIGHYIRIKNQIKHKNRNSRTRLIRSRNV